AVLGRWAASGAEAAGGEQRRRADGCAADAEHAQNIAPVGGPEVSAGHAVLPAIGTGSSAVTAGEVGTLRASSAGGRAGSAGTRRREAAAFPSRGSTGRWGGRGGASHPPRARRRTLTGATTKVG